MGQELSAAELFGACSLRELAVTGRQGWRFLNPSITQGPDGEYRGILRCSNYTEVDGRYIIHDHRGYIRTKNILVDFDDTLAITSMAEIDDSVVGDPVFPQVQGMEDARLFWNGHQWCSAGTSREHRQDGDCRMALDVLDGPVVQYRRYLPSLEHTTEKNWMPLIGTEKFVQQTFPTRMYGQLSGPGGHISERIYPTKPARVELSESLRGGSQVIRQGDGGIALVHEVTWEPRRHYWHRFVRFDEHCTAVAATPRFYFNAPGIEFAAGLVEYKDQYVASFGFRDQHAMLAYVPQGAVLDSLTPPGQ